MAVANPLFSVQADDLAVVSDDGWSRLENRGNNAPAGTYSIATGSDVRREDNVLIGLAQLDDNGGIIPTATVSLCFLTVRIHCPTKTTLAFGRAKQGHQDPARDQILHLEARRPEGLDC